MSLLTSRLERTGLFLGCLMSAIAGTGCAFGDRHVTLSYLPADDMTTRIDGQIAIVTFEDVRPRERLHDIGEVRNGFGMVTADVRIDTKKDQGNIQDIGAWVADALSQELTLAGAAVLRVDSVSEASGYPVVVSGTISKLWVNMYLQYDAKIRTVVTITRNGSVVFNESVKGDHEAMAWFASVSEYEKALTKTLQDWARNAVPIIADHAQ